MLVLVRAAPPIIPLPSRLGIEPSHDRPAQYSTSTQRVTGGRGDNMSRRNIRKDYGSSSSRETRSRTIGWIRRLKNRGDKSNMFQCRYSYKLEHVSMRIFFSNRIETSSACGVRRYEPITTRTRNAPPRHIHPLHYSTVPYCTRAGLMEATLVAETTCYW